MENKVEKITDSLSVFGDISKKIGHCEIHGGYFATVIQGHVGGCLACQEALLETESAEFVKKILARSNSVSHTAMLADAGVPKRFCEKGFANWIATTPEQQTVLNTAKEYVEKFPMIINSGASIIMAGLPGTGKSHLAVAIVESVLQKGYSALYISVLNAIRSITDCFNKNSLMTQGEAYSILEKPDLLVLDEAGIAYDSETTLQIIYEIVNRRYENNKPTILTTNDPIEKMKKLLGERTVDRLRENGGKLMVFDWPSMRGSLK